MMYNCSGELEGLCANFNQNLLDDYITKNNVDVRLDPDRSNILGISWKVPGGPPRFLFTIQLHIFK